MFTIDLKKKSYEVKGSLRFARDIETNLSTQQDGINQLNGMALLYMGLQSDSINALLNFLYYGIKASERPSMDIIEDSLDEMLAKDEDALENLFLKAIGVLKQAVFSQK